MQVSMREMLIPGRAQYPNADRVYLSQAIESIRSQRLMISAIWASWLRAGQRRSP